MDELLEFLAKAAKASEKEGSLLETLESSKKGSNAANGTSDVVKAARAVTYTVEDLANADLYNNAVRQIVESGQPVAEQDAQLKALMKLHQEAGDALKAGNKTPLWQRAMGKGKPPEKSAVEKFDEAYEQGIAKGQHPDAARDRANIAANGGVPGAGGQMGGGGGLGGAVNSAWNILTTPSKTLAGNIAKFIVVPAILVGGGLEGIHLWNSVRQSNAQADAMNSTTVIDTRPNPFNVDSSSAPGTAPNGGNYNGLKSCTVNDIKPEWRTKFKPEDGQVIDPSILIRPPADGRGCILKLPPPK